MQSRLPVERAALITTDHLRDFGGSELIAWELAEFLLTSGWSVDLFSFDIGGNMAREISARVFGPALRLFTSGSQDRLRPDYDLIWVQHGVLPAQILGALEKSGLRAPMVWHHMSTFLDIEMPRSVEVESALASMSTAMCSRAFRSLREHGISPQALVLFDNPAPDEFGDSPPRTDPVLRSVLFVSNHLVPELRDAARILYSRGVTTRSVGMQSVPVRVTADMLEAFDAVVTIGKTVQYALSAGIPAYVYDHFGGPGWLTELNFEAEHNWAFSGRASGQRLTPDQIADEIMRGFSDASAFVGARKDNFAARWRLSARVSNLLSDSRMQSRSRRARLTTRQAAQYRSLMGLQQQLSEVLGLHQQLDYRVELQTAALYMTGSASWKLSRPLRAAVDAQGHQHDVDVTTILRANVQDLETIVSKLATSRSWRLTRPLRWGRAASSHRRWLAAAGFGRARQFRRRPV